MDDTMIHAQLQSVGVTVDKIISRLPFLPQLVDVSTRKKLERVTAKMPMTNLRTPFCTTDRRANECTYGNPRGCKDVFRLKTSTSCRKLPKNTILEK